MSYLPATVRVMNDSTRHPGDADGSTASWTRFVVHLESRLTAIEPGGCLAIDMAGVAGDGAPYVQVAKSPEGDQLYAELSSHQFLDERFAIAPDVASSLLELGWFPPGGGGTAVDQPNFFVGADAGLETELASLIAGSFREAFPQFGPELLEQSIEGGDLPTKGMPGGVDRQRVSEVWADFASDFETRLLDLPSTSRLEMRVDHSLGDSSPTISACTVDHGRGAFIEVSSNQTLPVHARLSATQIGTLLSLGWNPPSAPHDDPQIPSFHVVARIEDLKVLATLLVDTLQTVFGIPHPAFLEPAPRETELHGPASSLDPHEEEDRLPIDQAYVPESLDDLRWAVSHVIRNTHGVYVAPDEDGTFALHRGNSGMLINVLGNGAISLLSFAVTSMRDPGGAAESLSRLNDSTPYVRFHVHDDSLIASCDIPAMPFVPAHLIEIMVTMTNVVDEVAPDLASLTGGTLLFSNANGEGSSSSEHEEDDALPEELLALIHMDNEPGIELSPELAARVFQRDRSLILDCIRQCEEQALSWSESAKTEEDDETAKVCQGEAEAWEDMASILRRSLPFTIE